MKISKLHIDSFRHLENLHFDFTYPEDFHIKEKRGKPLDKICFIGQSATGKTGLLELIFKEIESFRNTLFGDGTPVFLQEKAEFVENCELEFINSNDTIQIKQNKIIINQLNKFGNARDLGIGAIFNDNPYLIKLFYFKSNLVSEENISILSQHPLELIEKYKDTIVTDKRTDRKSVV